MLNRVNSDWSSDLIGQSHLILALVDIVCLNTELLIGAHVEVSRGFQRHWVLQIADLKLNGSSIVNRSPRELVIRDNVYTASVV